MQISNPKHQNHHTLIQIFNNLFKKNDYNIFKINRLYNIYGLKQSPNLFFWNLGSQVDQFLFHGMLE